MDKLTAELTNQCTCEGDEGEVLDYCYGDCYEDNLALVTEVINTWRSRNGDKATSTTIRIDGKAMTWERLDGHAIVDIEDIIKAVKINGDYRIAWKLDGDHLTATRYSHDEPTGCGFEFSFVPDELLLVD